MLATKKRQKGNHQNGTEGIQGSSANIDRGGLHDGEHTSKLWARTSSAILLRLEDLKKKRVFAQPPRVCMCAHVWQGARITIPRTRS